MEPKQEKKPEKKPEKETEKETEKESEEETEEEPEEELEEESEEESEVESEEEPTTFNFFARKGQPKGKGEHLLDTAKKEEPKDKEQQLHGKEQLKGKGRRCQASAASVKHVRFSPSCLGMGSTMAVFLIFVNIGMAILYNIEHQKYEKDRALLQLLRDFIIGNNEKLAWASDEVIFSLISNRTTGLLEIKESIRQLRIEASILRELTSGVTGQSYSFYQTLFYIPKKIATFDQAIQECAKINATLVSISTKEEQMFINQVVHRQFANEHWIGLFRNAKTNYKWTWLQKDAVYDIEYWNTKGNHPRHRPYVAGGPNCVANLKQCEQKEHGVWIRCWEDRKCSERYHFICRISKNERWI